MAISPATNATLEGHIARLGATRERVVVRFAALFSAACALLAVFLYPWLGGRLATALLGLAGFLFLYYFALGLLMRRGLYHPAIGFVNTLIEVGAPGVVMWLDVRTQGVAFALGSTSIVLWCLLIMPSSMRSSRLAYLAGALAGGEYLALYAILIAPHVGADAPATFTAPVAFVRAVFLFSTGVLSGLIARQLRAESAEILGCDPGA